MFRKIFRTFRLGIKSLLLHKLRSSLTVLGILIGVTSVIWLVAMGEGVSFQAQEQIKSLGANTVIVRTIKPSDTMLQARSPGGMPTLPEYGLTRADLQKLDESIPAISEILPIREITTTVTSGQEMIDARVVGCTPAYFATNYLARSAGRLLTEGDMDEFDNVVVLGDETANKLFGYRDPIGQTVSIDNQNFRVVGRTAFRTPSAGIGGSLSAQDFNLDVYMPLSTFRFRIGDRILRFSGGQTGGEIVQLSQITLKVADIKDVPSTADLVDVILKKEHGNANDYAIVVPQELLQQARVWQMLFTVLLILIASISLVVGGIGIMNIMLATVTERTREIGIRRALGARRSDIMWQFLTETLVLSLTGAGLGVVFGLLCQPVVGGLQEFAAKTYPEVWATLPDAIRDLKPRPTLWSILVSVGLALVTGLFFGLYPARSAARLDPIEALRHE